MRVLEPSISPDKQELIDQDASEQTEVHSLRQALQQILNQEIHLLNLPGGIPPPPALLAPDSNSYSLLWNIDPHNELLSPL